MKIKSTIEFDNARIVEVKDVWSADEANRLIKEGWCVMSSGCAHRDAAGYQARPMWTVAKFAADKH